MARISHGFDVTIWTQANQDGVRDLRRDAISKFGCEQDDYSTLIKISNIVK